MTGTCICLCLHFVDHIIDVLIEIELTQHGSGFQLPVLAEVILRGLEVEDSVQENRLHSHDQQRETEDQFPVGLASWVLGDEAEDIG